MHDPMTLVKDINFPLLYRHKGKLGIHPYHFLSIWHVDPETDGTDDSCGWFMRARHGDKNTLEKIEREYRSEIKWLLESKCTTYTSFALVLFHRALYTMFGDWRKVNKYMDKHLHDILFFANNPVDSIDHQILSTTPSNIDEKARYFADTIYGYILRDLQPWYKHPRWHIHHWKINIQPIQALKRWLFSRCYVCGKRFPFGSTNVICDHWDSPGPQWFKGERGLRHFDCRNPFSSSPDIASVKINNPGDVE